MSIHPSPTTIAAPADPPTPCPTLILDGIWGRPWRFQRLRRKITDACGPAEIHRYDSTGLTPIDQLGAGLAQSIRRHGGPVNLIGFSMGGLIIRAAHQSDPDLPIRRVVFLNSPLHGSWLAWLLSLPAVRQMRPSSSFLKSLASTPWTLPTLCVWCPFDQMVIPGASARWKCATECVCSCVPLHAWPAYSPAIHRRILQFLASP